MSGTLVIGDVHGCAGELDRLLRKVRPERVILVGDLFTRGPDPRGVWDLVRTWNADAVLGNHDEHVLKRWKPGSKLPKKAFRWLRDRPWKIKGKGWGVVHAGVHPDGFGKTERKHALHLRRWTAHKHWWELYRGRRLIVHGHDASVGLLDRRPFSLGLDTGCVRGGRLTGWIAEEDRIVSVRARRDYAAA